MVTIISETFVDPRAARRDQPGQSLGLSPHERAGSTRESGPTCCCVFTAYLLELPSHYDNDDDTLLHPLNHSMPPPPSLR